MPVSPFAPLGGIDDARAYAESLFTGERVRLRALRDDDLPVLEQWWADPRVMVLQSPMVTPQPAGTAAEMFSEWSTNKSGNSVGFSIETRETGRFIGHTTLFGRVTPSLSATMAIVIGPEYQSQGLGSDAVRVICRYGFLQMGLNRIELRTYAFNTRGLAAYRSAGFVEEGRRREAVYFNGTRHDEVIMSLLKREWAEQELLPR